MIALSAASITTLEEQIVKMRDEADGGADVTDE
jgi:hypothetical protein